MANYCRRSDLLPVVFLVPQSPLGIEGVEHVGHLGHIPDAVASWSKMTKLWMENCTFDGSIPDTVGSVMLEIEQLVLYKNRIRGPIPDAMGSSDCHIPMEPLLSDSCWGVS